MCNVSLSKLYSFHNVIVLLCIAVSHRSTFHVCLRVFYNNEENRTLCNASLSRIYYLCFMSVLLCAVISHQSTFHVCLRVYWENREEGKEKRREKRRERERETERERERPPSILQELFLLQHLQFFVPSLCSLLFFPSLFFLSPPFPSLSCLFLTNSMLR